MVSIWTEGFRAVERREYPDELHTGDLVWFVEADVPQMGAHGGVAGTAVERIAGPFVDERTAQDAVVALAALPYALRETCGRCGRMAAAHDPMDGRCADENETAQAFLTDTAFLGD